jgi:hypothetical protein
MMLNVVVYDASRFAWKGNEGVAFASDLGTQFRNRIWQDSCDVGFKVKSPKTGRTVLFIEATSPVMVEGEVSAWVFRSYREASVITITVFNT